MMAQTLQGPAGGTVPFPCMQECTPSLMRPGSHTLCRKRCQRRAPYAFYPASRAAEDSLYQSSVDLLRTETGRRRVRRLNERKAQKS